MEAPEKIYLQQYDENTLICLNKWNVSEEWSNKPCNEKVATNIEYTRTDAFIKRALKWYCLDCECNDNCKNTECFFKGQFRRYLKGNDNDIPPKISNCILNEDGPLSENWRYRHIIDAFIEKAANWINEHTSLSEKMVVENFVKYMEGE